MRERESLWVVLISGYWCLKGLLGDKVLEPPSNRKYSG